VASGLTSASYTLPAASPEAEGTWNYHVKASEGTLDSAYSAASGSVVVDKKAPNAPTLSTDRPADYTGWWKDSVKVSFAGNGDPALADGSAGSGVDPASIPAAVTKTASGTVSGSVKDLAGNVSAAGSMPV